MRNLRMTIEVGDMKGDGPIDEQVFVAEHTESLIHLGTRAVDGHEEEVFESGMESLIQLVIRESVHSLFVLKEKSES